MIKKEELNDNINTDYYITKEFLKESRYGLCKYIVDICNQIDLPNEIASIAMVYVNYFFIKKCYINYDKLIIACACILVACKCESHPGKLTDLCNAYLNNNNKIFGVISTVIKPEEIHKVKDRIFIAEMSLLKTLNFQINFNLPYEFIYIYSELLYPENTFDMVKYAHRIANDSFYTYVNLLYKNYVVALACIIVAAKFLGIPGVFDKNFKHLDNMKAFSIPPCTEEEFNKKLLNENRNQNISNLQDNTDSYFDILEFHKKLHPNLELNELYECVNMLIEFYEDMKNQTIKN